MPRSFFLACVVVTLSGLCFTTDAHTKMSIPIVAFPKGFYDGSSPMGRIDGETFKTAASIPSYHGVDKITKVLESYKTLRQMVTATMNLSTVDGFTGNKQCGLTLTNSTKQPIPAAVVFEWRHPGPCEVWCDNTRIFFNANCRGNNVGKVAIDKAKCKGVNLIQAMYVGVHIPNWEVYVNCAPMEGGTKTDPKQVLNNDASGNSTSDPATSSSDDEDEDENGASIGGEASGSTNTTPDLTPATPATSADSSASPSTTEAPATTTKTPAATKASKCKATE